MNDQDKSHRLMDLVRVGLSTLSVKRHSTTQIKICFLRCASNGPSKPKKKKKKMCPRACAKCTDSSHAEPHSYICSLLIISVVIIIIIGFFINVQVQGQHPHQWAPFQVAGLLHAWQISHQISRYVYHEG